MLVEAKTDLIFHGVYSAVVDGKGRVGLPQGIHSTLQNHSEPDCLVATLSADQPFIILRPAEQWKAFELKFIEQFKQGMDFQPELTFSQRRSYACHQKVDIANNRFLLPQPMRSLIGIDGGSKEASAKDSPKVVLQGAVHYIELWSEQAWLEGMRTPGPADAPLGPDPSFAEPA